jgi:hypothetical protein
MIIQSMYVHIFIYSASSVVTLNQPKYKEQIFDINI